MTVIKDSRQIIEQNGKHYFVSEFKKELTKDEIEHNKGFLQKNIDTLKQMLSNMDIEKTIKLKEKELDAGQKVREESLKNFDKYINEMIKDIKRDKVKKKLQTQALVSKYDELKILELDKLRNHLIQQKKNIAIQLENEEPVLELYNGY